MDSRDSYLRSLSDWEPKWMSCTKLAICYIVIHVNSTFFVLLRERILGSEMKFPCPLFLVFASQLMSLVVASIICIIRRHEFTRQRQLEFWKPKMYIRKMPLIQFALMALSDSIGRSLQIETRRTHNVTFSIRILLQSFKTIPVMILGIILLNIKYKFRDFFDMSLLSLLIAFFIIYARESGELLIPGTEEQHLSSSSSSSSMFTLLPNNQTSVSGLFMISIYTLCDAFTLQWQMRLYERFQIDQYTVMMWLNACQLIVVGGVLLVSGDGIVSLTFLTINTNVFKHIIALTVLSTTSQLVVLYLIRRFGPIVYTTVLNSKNLINMIFSTLICGISLKSSLHCLNLYSVFCRPIPLITGIGAVSILISKAYTSPPLAIEMRSAPAEVDFVV